MLDELDARLNASAPAAPQSRSIDDQLIAMAVATRNQAHQRRHSLRFRVGIPVIAGAIALSCAGAAFASPAIQQSLGLSHPQPKAVLQLPISDCTMTTYLRPSAPLTLTADNLATLEFAANYLDHVDVRRIERSQEFRSQFSPIVTISPPSFLGDSKAEQKAQQRQFLATDEQLVLGAIILPEVRDAAAAKGHDPSIIGWNGRLSCSGSTQ